MSISQPTFLRNLLLRSLFLCCGVLALGSSAVAQTGTPASKYVFDQDAPDLATAQSYSYRAYVDGATAGLPLTITCVGTASPFVCSAPVGALTPGPHSVTVTTGNVAGESAKSAAVSFQMVIVPAVPRNLRIQ